MIRLHGYQQKAHDRLVEILTNHPGALDASDTGVGKSYVAAAVAKTLKSTPCVICPKAVVPMWKDLLQEAGLPNWAVGTWEGMRAKTLPFGRDLFILDECQKMRGRNTLNYKLAINCLRAGKVLCLSATAASNPLEMKALGRVLELYPAGSFWSWAKEHGCRKGFFGGMEYVGGAEGMTRIHSRIFPHRGVRLRISEIPEFPETDIQADVLDFGEPVEEMANEIKLIEEAAAKDKDPDNPLTIQTRDRQRAEILKVPTLVELIQEWNDAGRSVALFANYNTTLEAIRQRLPLQSEIFNGKTPEEEREKFRNRFQEDSLRVLLINIQAGGTGLSLHDVNGKFPRVSLICPSFSVTDYRQSLGRVHRAGSKSKSIQKILFSSGTVEVRVAKLLREKNFRLDLLNDADLINPPSEESALTPERKSVTVPPQLDTKVADVMNEKPSISPSSLKYVKLSPCFKNDQGGDKTAADEGTKLHAACETGNMPADLNAEQVQSVQMCLDYVNPLINTPGAKVYRELSFTELSDLSPTLRRGKADLVVLYPNNTAELVDYKMGKNPVDDASENDQQKAYVVAMFRRWPKLLAVRVHLLLPRRGEVSVHTFQRKEQGALEKDLASIVLRVEKYYRENLTEPRTDTCLWCARRHSCPAVVGTAITVARNYDAELKIPEEFHPSKVTDPKSMAVMLNAASVMDNWVASVRHHFTQAALNGADIPGYELRERKSTRSLEGAKDTFAAVSDVVSIEEFVETCSVSMADLEKLWCSKAAKGKKGKAKEVLMSKLIEAGVLHQGSPTLFLGKVKK